MEEFFQVIAFIIFGVFILVSRYKKKKKLADQDRNPQDEGGMKLPSWLTELVEGDEIKKPTPPQQEHAQTTPPQMEQGEREQPVVPSKPPKPEEPSSALMSPPPKERKIAGLPLSPKTFRQAVILSEILKPAKSVQK